MQDGTFRLLGSRRFLPLFITQFLGAANDNLFKNALVILIIYRLGEGLSVSPQLLVTAAAGLLILPFFLFSATAGQLADRFEKSGLVRLVKMGEVGIALLGIWSLLAANVIGMMAVLFLLGLQSALFGPLKYAILPEYLDKTELIGGNALIEGGTFLAILLGTIAGGLLILGAHGEVVVSVLMMLAAVGGLAAAWFMPPGRDGNPAVRLRANILADTAQVLRLARSRRDVWLSILGVSWFWLVGATYLSQFPAFAKDVLGADEHAVTLMLTVFSVGIGLGSVLCGRLLKGEISARHVPFAALGMTVFALDLWLASRGMRANGGELAPLSELLSRFGTWRLLADFLLMAICGGVYIVPLYAIMQARSDEDARARAVAANNIMNAAFMVVSAGASGAMLAAGFSVPQVFLVVAIANLAAAVIICGLLPDAVLKGLFSWLLRRLFRVRISGLENLEAAGERAVIVVNHVSFLDAVLMAAFLPGRPTFAINTFVAQLWWVKPFLAVVDAHPLDPTNPMATKGLIRAVQEGRTLVIFPEGRITVTGALMKVYEGPGMIADRADAAIVPVRIDGAQFTMFSRLKGKVRRRWFPPIEITILEPRRFKIPAEIKGRARRQRIGVDIYDIMSDMMFRTSHCDRTLFGALLDAKRLHGAKAPVAEDILRAPMGYGRLVTASLALGRVLSRQSGRGHALGVMLPNSTAAAVTFFALQAFGRVPAMLNFSTGAHNVLAACEAACIGTIVTSRRFIEQARLAALADALAARHRLIYLEDLRDRMGLLDRLFAGLAAPFARWLHRRTGARPDDAAVVLFTSGSEGTPKGVVLSHRNILSNCAQLGARVAFSPADTVFNALPVFHSFGLTGGMLLPMLSGIKCFFYPSPLHYRIVPEMVYDTNATILFGTDTFLSGYARVASAYDFYSLRYVFAGAERVKEATRQTWMDKFGLRILEGYGATETAPVLAVNTPMHFKAGTVGRLLPGIEALVETVPGLTEGGRLWVRGPNVMKGYLRVEKPGELQPPPQGWYDTGDIVTIDTHGFIRIAGRAKRFAKIAGEMVSLGKVEAEVTALWPENQHVALALNDERKGEQLVLVTDRGDAGRDAILAHFRAAGLSELLVPKTILKVDRLPLLGTGKTDMVAVQSLAEAFIRG